MNLSRCRGPAACGGRNSARALLVRRKRIPRSHHPEIFSVSGELFLPLVWLKHLLGRK